MITPVLGREPTYNAPSFRTDADLLINHICYFSTSNDQNFKQNILSCMHSLLKLINNSTTNVSTLTAISNNKYLPDVLNIILEQAFDYNNSSVYNYFTETHVIVPDQLPSTEESIAGLAIALLVKLSNYPKIANVMIYANNSPHYYLDNSHRYYFVSYPSKDSILFKLLTKYIEHPHTHLILEHFILTNNTNLIEMVRCRISFIMQSISRLSTTDNESKSTICFLTSMMEHANLSQVIIDQFLLFPNYIKDLLIYYAHCNKQPQLHNTINLLNILLKDRRIEAIAINQYMDMSDEDRQKLLENSRNINLNHTLDQYLFNFIDNLTMNCILNIQGQFVVS